MSASIYEIPVRRITGDEASLAEYKGKVVLIVNVASKCGLTPQYAGLEKLYQDYRDKGLVVAGFPSNDFAGQEPGTHEEIVSFCSTNYGVDFPLYEKTEVTGEGAHPLYNELVKAQPKSESTSGEPLRDKLKGYGLPVNPEPGVLWNFEKFLVSRGGDVVARFSPDMTPEDPVLVKAVEAELAKA